VIGVVWLQVVAVHATHVRPHDGANVNWELLKTLGFVDTDLLTAPSLTEALGQFDAYVHNQNADNVRMATDGPLPIRQVSVATRAMRGMYTYQCIVNYRCCIRSV
jgi:hypothetical protein